MRVVILSDALCVALRPKEDLQEMMVGWVNVTVTSRTNMDYSLRVGLLQLQQDRLTARMKVSP